MSELRINAKPETHGARNVFLVSYDPDNREIQTYLGEFFFDDVQWTAFVIELIGSDNEVSIYLQDNETREVL